MAISAEELETLLKESFPKGAVHHRPAGRKPYAVEVLDESFRGWKPRC